MNPIDPILIAGNLFLAIVTLWGIGTGQAKGHFPTFIWLLAVLSAVTLWGKLP